MKKVSINSYVPFQHEDFEYTKNIIDLARKQQNANNPEGTLAATLIYNNAVDYICAHLLENLSKIIFLVSNEELNGVVFKYPDQSGNMPLGTMIKELEKYEFPNKALFIEDLKCFLQPRNKATHYLLRLNKEELAKIDDELTHLHEIAERLLSTYDTTNKGISENWRLYCEKKIPRKPTMEEASAAEENIPTASTRPKSKN